MKQPKSLQKTLSVGLTLGVSLLWMAAFAGAVMVAQQSLNAIFDNTLRETAQRIMSLAVVEILNREDETQAQSIMSLDVHDEHITYLVRDKTGNVLMKSHHVDLAVYEKPRSMGFSSTEKYRFYAAPAVRETLFIEVAESLQHRRQIIMKTAWALLWPLILLIPFCFAGSWFFVRYSLRYVLDYRSAIESRGSADLSPIDTRNLPEEVKTIADAVNEMLSRLRRSLERERSFTANSAHELRTPIATALAQVQRLQQMLPADPILDHVDKIENSLRGLANLSEKLMQLAKAESASLKSASAHNLVPLLVFIIEEYRRLFSQRVIHLWLPDSGEFMSSVDADAFAILVRNLVENALKHGARDQAVDISFSKDGLLRVVNGGHIIPKQELGSLRQRFYRSNAGVQGSGLGLAIADALVQGMGASMTLYSPATGRKDGFEVLVRFSPDVKEAV